MALIVDIVIVDLLGAFDNDDDDGLSRCMISIVESNYGKDDFENGY